MILLYFYCHERLCGTQSGELVPSKMAKIANEVHGMDDNSGLWARLSAVPGAGLLLGFVVRVPGSNKSSSRPNRKLLGVTPAVL